MSENEIGRRTFLKGAGLAALTTVGVIQTEEVHGQFAAPNSAGTEASRLKAPANACDCHHHIYDARFPFSQPGARMVPNSRVADYRLLQRRTGTTRSVVVTPAPYPASVADNQVTVDALAQFGANARGVAIVSPTITDAELKALAAAGFRGIRFSLAQATTLAPAIDAIEPLSKRVNALGWHVQINMTADQIVAAGDLWNRLPSTLVFDHMGHMPQPTGTGHPAFTIIRRLVDKGRTWVKLSVTYDSSKVGPPTYADVNKVGRAYVEAAPERMVWGSNWPHPNETDKPNDAVLFGLLADWAPNEATRRRILVENPETLYGFSKSG
jgi:predicted TIM-barrel fold metal-dependent hydrolase